MITDESWTQNYRNTFSRKIITEEAEGSLSPSSSAPPPSGHPLHSLMVMQVLLHHLHLVHLHLPLPPTTPTPISLPHSPLWWSLTVPLAVSSTMPTMVIFLQVMLLPVRPVPAALARLSGLQQGGWRRASMDTAVSPSAWVKPHLQPHI